jgi:tRNA pseudouridine38-40 synthase
MRNIKLTLEYDGTDFVGWQVQPNGRSVQEELERALAQILQHTITTYAAGRTDSGVHARGQVVNVKTQKAIVPEILHKSLNALLPDDVAVLSVEEVPEHFHARYSAVARRYRYFIAQRPLAVMRRFVWPLQYPLSFELMNSCAASIVGEHDFQSFCKAEAEVDHYRCTVKHASWIQKDGLVVFDITANRFLHGMVRALVGTMVDVGRGYTPYEDFERIIVARDRRAAGMAAPAKGLFLEEVFYD